MSHGGHLFIIDGDITKLACDAWLLPTDPSFSITESFCRSLGMNAPGVLPGRSLGDWGDQGCILHLPAEEHRPDLWLGDVGRLDDTPVEHFVQRATEFVERAAAHARHRLAPSDRRPLLAINALGTGRGGKRQRRGEVLTALLPALIGAAERARADVVLVAFGSVMYSAAQSARRALEGGDTDPWAALPLHLQARAEQLASRAEQGELVLFMGAGISRDAGIPVWLELISDLASRLGRSPEWLASVKDLDPRDQASLLRAPDPAEFDAAVDDIMSRERYSLMHGLLASLPINENVTTNFDELFEAAAQTDGRQISVIPSDSEKPGSRWLLKLHGTIGNKDNRVFTRSEYLGAMSAHTALRGLVQAMLLTRYMMFVGYSLKDEDFHHLVHDVRAALPKHVDGDEHAAANRRMGIVLSPTSPSPAEALWPELDFLSFASDGLDNSGTRSTGESARIMSVFLDFVGSRAASEVSFVADDSLGSLRSEDERILADVVTALERLLERAPANGWHEVRAFVQHFKPARGGSSRPE